MFTHVGEHLRPSRADNPVVLPADVHPVMTALAQGVPLTLLLDLADPAGPESARILAAETADLAWMAELAFPAVAPEPARRAATA